MAFAHETVTQLTRIAVERQTTGRVPGLAAGVARKGRLDWWHGVGTADLARHGEAPDDDTAFLVASNTKTFVAVVIMALRDEGLLSLDDTIDQHVPGTTHPGVTIRQALAHVTGMQREPVGDVWDVLEFPDRAGLIRGWNQAERILKPHFHWHYSNLAYAVLGEVVARLDGGDWFASVRRRILQPLEMTRTTVGYAESGRRAGAYFVPPYSDVPVQEPYLPLQAVAPAGALASTLRDMATWGGFVADPVEDILSRDTMEEMCQPQILSDLEGWSAAWGLGLMLVRAQERTWVGHTGGMPGAITGIFTHRESATTGLLLMNSSASPVPAAGAIELGSYAVEHDPVAPEPWVPGTSVPEDLRPLLGRWFSEGRGFSFSVRQAVLEARLDSAPEDTPPSVFERVEADVYRTVSGREQGELLRIRRRADGSIRALNWATYAFTREPYAFGE